MTRNRRSMMLLLMIAGGTGWGNEVLAQSVVESPSSTQAGALTEVVVTARKRTEDLKDVPIAMTALGADQLANMAAGTLKDLHASVPSLSYSDRGALQTQINIRGVGGDSRNIGIESGVALYVDGVFAGRTSGYNIDLADVDHVEVLRGPQGTLFGKNTTGGAVLMTTTKPGKEFTADAGASYGNYDAVRLNGLVSGPITDTLYGKFAASTWDRDGYLNNIYNGSKLQSEQRRSAHGQLRFLPNDALELNLRFDGSRDRDAALLNQLGSNAAFGKGYYTPSRYQVNTDSRNFVSRDILGGSLSVDYTLPNSMTLTSITALRRVDVTVFSDLDQTPVNLLYSGPFTDDEKHFSEELRLASAPGGPLSYVMGAYFFRQQASAERNIYQRAVPLFFTNGPIDTRSVAGFINADYKLTDRWTLTGGLRLTNERKKGHYTQTSQVAPGFNHDFPDLYLSQTAVSWTGALSYKITDDVSSYVSASRGFKSGGFNVDPLATAVPLQSADITFKQETVTSYELGTKANLFEHRARLNAALFFAQYDNRQVPIYETVGGIPTVITRNAGTAQIKGLEAELTTFVSRYLQINSGLSVMDGKYTSFHNATSAGADYTDHTTENTPKYSVNLGADLKLPTSVGQWVLAPQLSYIGKTYLQPDNARFNTQGGYLLASVRSGFDWQDGRYGLYVWGKNLTNARYKEFTRQFSGSDQVLWGEPITYGLQFVAHF